VYPAHFTPLFPSSARGLTRIHLPIATQDNRFHGRCVQPVLAFSGASLHFPRHGKSSAGFGPHHKHPQSAKDHKGDPGRQQMSGCRNHHNYSDRQDHVGPIDVIFGGHDTCPRLDSRLFVLAASAAPRLRPDLLLSPALIAESAQASTESDASQSRASSRVLKISSSRRE
jgi:hypothetical protein